MVDVMDGWLTDCCGGCVGRSTMALIIITMKIKELNKKIFHNAAQLNREDYLTALSYCYEHNQNASSNRQQRMDTCMQKWKNLYAHLDSSEVMDSYTLFFRIITHK
jgi:hypothetical protein